MPAPQFSEGGLGRHLHHRAAGVIGQEEPPDLVVSGDDVSPHLETSEVNPVPESCLWWNNNIVEYLTGVRLSQCSSRIFGIIVLLQGTEFLEGLIYTQMFPEMDTG